MFFLDYAPKYDIMLSMRNAVFLALFLACFYTEKSVADNLDLNDALKNTYTACVNIDDNLHELKVLAGVNTAVTAVGTAVGVGAVATGFAKVKTDADIDRLEQYLKTIEEAGKKQQTEKLSVINVTQEQINALFEDSNKSLQQEKQELEKLNKKSKSLGNWRTGLMAGNTATNITGAIISSKTINKSGIQEQIEKCISATKDLNNAIIVAKLEGIDTSEAKSVYEACREYEYVDISPINKRGKGAMISSSVGAVVGGIGTITSGVANSDNIRNDDSEVGKKKEKDLNTASNVLAVGATATSATATIFNATQITAIKKLASVSEKCTGVLK